MRAIDNYESGEREKEIATKAIKKRKKQLYNYNLKAAQNGK